MRNAHHRPDLFHAMPFLIVLCVLLVTRGRLISECCICFTNFIRRRANTCLCA